MNYIFNNLNDHVPMILGNIYGLLLVSIFIVLRKYNKKVNNINIKLLPRPSLLREQSLLGEGQPNTIEDRLKRALERKKYLTNNSNHGNISGKFQKVTSYGNLSRSILFEIQKFKYVRNENKEKSKSVIVYLSILFIIYLFTLLTITMISILLKK